MLSQIKLEIPGKQEPLPALRPQLIGSGQPEGSRNASILTIQETEEEYDRESTVSPSDEKAEEDEAPHSPTTLEKKKMKRFR